MKRFRYSGGPNRSTDASAPLFSQNVAVGEFGSRLLWRIALEDRLPSRLRLGWRKVFGFLGLLLREKKNGGSTGLNWRTRLRLWRRGFLSESALLYCLRGESAGEDYLTDFQRYVGTPGINGDSAVLLDDKLLFYLSLSGITEKIVPVWAVSSRAGWLSLQGGAFVPLLDSLDGQALILKPRFRDGGFGILKLEVRESGLHLRDRQVSLEELHAWGRSMDLVCAPFVSQDGYAGRIFPGATNTLRILTLGTPDGPFLAAAVHRFGTRRSAPADNWTQGGLSASIDPGTGRLGKGIVFRPTGALEAFRDHPDSGAPIEGIEIPQWQLIRESVLELAGRLPFLPYIGWDLIPRADDFLILEGNSRTDVNLFQVHQGLLRDERVRDFYVRHGVIRRPLGGRARRSN